MFELENISWIWLSVMILLTAKWFKFLKNGEIGCLVKED